MLDIIIPVYNEKENICKTLYEIQNNVDVNYNVCIVYDFPEDNTLPEVKKYCLKYSVNNIKCIHNDLGKGVCNALKKGLKTINAPIFLIVMGDISDDLKIVPQMIKMINEDGCDVVCGSRYMAGGKQLGGPPIKNILAKMAGLSLHWLTHIPTHDISNSYKMYRTTSVRQQTIESTEGFTIGLELLVKIWKSGGKVGEIPSIWRERNVGKSRFRTFRWLPYYLRWYIYALSPFSKKNKEK